MSNYSSEKIEKQEYISYLGYKDLLIRLVERCRDGFKVVKIDKTKKGCGHDCYMECEGKDGKTHYFYWEQKGRTSTEEARKKYSSSELKVSKKRSIQQSVQESINEHLMNGESLSAEQIHVFYIQMLYKDGATLDYTDSYNKHSKIFDGVSWDKMMIYNLRRINWEDIPIIEREQKKTQYDPNSKMVMEKLYQIPFSKGQCYDKESDKLCRI